MSTRYYLGWTGWLALICGGVASCSGAEVPAEPTGSSDDELRGQLRCAGPDSVPCGDGSYCSSKVGKCPDEQRSGRCAPRPEVCTKEFVPVCGCDGVTYGNSCEAAQAGVSVASAGECEVTGAFCGGIAGFPCPEGQTCVDAPDDDCDPEMGGADCGGICVDAELNDPCATVRCKEGRQCVSDGKRARCVKVEPETCGDVICGPGTDCCNPLRGICTPPGVFCIQ